LRGLQGEMPGERALGTPKHYVGDGGTAWGSSTTGDYQIDQGVTKVDEATLRAVHLPPYQAAIDAGAQSIMVSFSSWGGMKMSAQKYLITDVLKKELGFSGFVVSDWQSIDQISPDYYAAVVAAINAGIDMNMVSYSYRGFIDTLTQAVNKGDVPVARIDDAVSRILKVKLELGLFEHPFSDAALRATIGSDAHRALAREAVAKSLVLLKNEGHVLPLSKDLPKLFVAGVGADDIGMQSGGWTIEWQGQMGDITPGTTILEAISATVSPGTAVEYNAGGQFDGHAGVCLAVVGEQPYAEGQGDRADLSLSPADTAMLDRLAPSCDKVVTILLSGRPLIVTDRLDGWAALVAAWLPGTEGQGVADVLFGDRPSTGKLPYTWPRAMSQVPFDFSQMPETGCDAPLFPFGYGLDAESEGTVKVPQCP